MVDASPEESDEVHGTRVNIEYMEYNMDNSSKLDLSSIYPYNSR